MSSTSFTPTTAASADASAQSSATNELVVMKRSGKLEPVSFDKILNRLKKLGNEVGLTRINYAALTIKVIEQLRNNISTTKLDELAAEQCTSMSSTCTDYGVLASRIIVSNHQKNTVPNFATGINRLYAFVGISGHREPLINDRVKWFVDAHHAAIEAMIHYDRDYLIDYFGFKTLERAYLCRIGNDIIERPQHMWMRVAIGIHGKNGPDADEELRKVKETYDLMSLKYFTHATPTLFNAGTPNEQLSSCYLLAMKDDSLDGIFDTLKDCASISKHAGGIGMHIHNIRGKGTHIHGTNGTSNGLVPMLRTFNATARYVDQGGGRRSGSFAVYLEPWHSDIVSFLDLRKNHGDEELKARDLFYALWVSDLFMERIKNDEKWTLMCPKKCPGLSDVYGDDFTALYERYEANGNGIAMSARELWFKILDAQMETGTPYLLYKDAVNRKTNQKNVGVIKSSNLCCEVMEYSDKDETAVCNLASIGLPTFVDPVTKQFDYHRLHEVVKVMANNLNEIIDINYYPTPETKLSNMRHRPVGIGVQGLADTFFRMDVAFDSLAAGEINRLIFETIYHAALEKSNEIAVDRYNSQEVVIETMTADEYARLVRDPDTMNFCGAYSRFIGSPASKGVLQFDMWGVTPTPGRYDWDKLRADIMEHGLRNALSVAPMPTASTSQILGYNECFEPITGNIYSRRTSAGEFMVVNKYLLDDLTAAGEWNLDVKNSIVENGGSIQHLTQLSQHIRDKYKTVWEIKMKRIIDMSADRGAFVCQSQSLNLWMADPSYDKLTSMHFYAWNKGLKTGIYYLRRKAKHQAQQFTLEPTAAAAAIPNKNDDEVCEMCSA